MVAGEIVGEIGAGLCVLLGVARGDEPSDAERLAGRVARLRIFENENGKFDHSLVDTGGAALVVSQFTLIANTAKGNRPSFVEAAEPEVAEGLYEAFCAGLTSSASSWRPASSQRGCGLRSRTRARSRSCSASAIVLVTRHPTGLMPCYPSNHRISAV